jgi:arylsulfatase
VRFEFAYDACPEPCRGGGGLGKGGKAMLYVNGDKVAEGRLEHTQAMIFSADETADVGVDEATPVTEDYTGNSRFSGKIVKVTVDVADPKIDAQKQQAIETAANIAVLLPVRKDKPPN